MYIASFRIQIGKKLNIKLKNVTIKNSSSEVNLEKIKKNILYATKFINYFSYIEIENLKKENFTLKKMILDNKKIVFLSNLITLQGKFQYQNNTSYFKLESLKFLNNEIKNADVNIILQPLLLINASFEFKNNPINLNATLNKNILKYKLTSPLFKLNNFNINNLSIKGKLNVNNLYTKASLYAKKINVIFDKKAYTVFNTTVNFDNNNLDASIEKIKIPYKEIKNLKTSKIFVKYLNNSFMIFSKNIFFNFDLYKIKLFNTKVLIKNLEAIQAQIPLIKIQNQHLNSILKETLILKEKNKIIYKVNNSTLLTKEININASTLIGDMIKASLKKVEGRVYNIPVYISNIKANVKDRKITAQEGKFNKIKIYSLTLKDNIFSCKSNTLLNKNLKHILKNILDIDIPIIQLSGKNLINFKINTKTLQSFTNITSFDTHMKILNNSLCYKKGLFKINNTETKFNLKDACFNLFNDTNIFFDTNGSINYNTLYLKLNSFIKELKIADILRIKNFKDFIIIDLDKLLIKTFNSHLYIDLKNEFLKVSNIKPLLPYTPFNNFIEDGNLTLIFKDKIKIFTSIIPTINIINKTPLNLNIFLDKKVTIFNNFLNIQIDDKNISASIKNTDLNLTELSNLTSNSDTSNKKNIHLLTQNTNFLYKNYKLLSQKATLDIKKEITFKSSYKNSRIKAYTKQKYFLLEGNHFTKEELKALSGYSLKEIKKINIDFVTIKTPDDIIFGKIFINSGIIKQLKALNNIVAFINTIPALLSLNTPGFSAKGFKIKEGIISFILYKNRLYIKKAIIDGENLSFFTKGYIDLNTKKVYLKLTANLKMKLKKLPIVGKGASYLLFGKDGNIDIKIIVKGNIKDPKIKKDIGKDLLITPFNLIKRTLTLPFNLF